MADTLCGPSNALQNFQKHTSVDRTLQQDRLTNRQSPAQGFRSQDPHAGILDPEFAAFEAGFGPGPSLPELRAPSPFAQGHSQLPAFARTDNLGWASDFQRLQISQPSPTPQQQFRTEAPLHRSSPRGWHAEFIRQQKAPATQQRVESMTSKFQPNYMHSQSMPYMMDGGLDQMQGPSGSQELSQQAQQENFDDAAFEDAFVQLSADIEMRHHLGEVKEDGRDLFQDVLYVRYVLESSFKGSHENLDETMQGTANWFTWLEKCDPLPAEVIRGTDIGKALRDIIKLDSIPQGDVYNFKTRARELNATYARILEESVASTTAPEIEETQRIGADTIPAKEESDDEELAKTAGDLLNSLQGDQSQKFRESNFLALMRRLRDREVQFQGNEFKDMAHALHPGGQFYPEEFIQESTHASIDGSIKNSQSLKIRAPEAKMTGAITGDDIDKIDDLASCGFGVGIGTPPEERKKQEDLMIQELNLETELFQRQQLAELAKGGFEIGEDASVWETHAGHGNDGVEGRPRT